MKVAVIGAGLVGLASAHALADDGHEVMVIEREGPAAGASRGNAGWLAHTDIDPIASPGMLLRVPGYLLDPVGPLAIRARYLLPILPWLARLLLASRPAQLARSIEAIVSINRLSMPAWDALSGQLGLQSFIHRRGGLFAYDSPASLAHARAHHARQRGFGITVEELDGPALRQMEPNLSEALAGAAFYPDAAHVSDPRLVTEALFAACAPRGIGFVRAEVAGIAANGAGATLSFTGGDTLRADRVVLAAGAWSRPLAAQLGDIIPLDTERGYNVSFPGVTTVLSRPVSFDGHGFVATPLDTGLRIGGAVELGGLQLPPNHARTRALHTKAQRFLRQVPPLEQGEMWMGFRPSIPDSLPVIGTARAPSVVYAFGHGHYGLTQSAATGRIAAHLIAGRKPGIDLKPFSPQRF